MNRPARIGNPQMEVSRIHPTTLGMADWTGPGRNAKMNPGMARSVPKVFSENSGARWAGFSFHEKTHLC